MNAAQDRALPQWMLTALLLLLCGAMALPMLPIWQGGVRILAGIVLVTILTPRPPLRWTAGTMLSTCVLAAVAAWATSFVGSPVAHVIRSLTDVFGQALGAFPDAVLLAYDVVCVLGLAAAYLKRHRRPDLAANVFVATLTLFWLWGLLTLAAHILRGLAGETFSQMATGLSGWATWLYWAFLVLILVDGAGRIRLAMKTLALAGLFVGTVIALQWLSKDFSYFIAGLGEPGDGFQRVRGTDYYHAPASYATAFAALALLGLAANGRAFWPLLGAAFLVAITLLNNTRAISLSLLAGAAALALLALLQRRWQSVLAALAIAALVAPTVVYLKPTNRPPSPTIASKPAEPAGASLPPLTEPELRTPPITTQPAPATLEAVASANAPRASLATAGTKILADNWLLGQGIGTLELPLEGNTFNGLKSTYSTHTLYLDIALMGGLPSLLFCLAAFIAAMVGTLSGTIRPAAPPLAPALLAMLLTFSVASLFLPQERNEVIGIAFAVAALALRSRPATGVTGPLPAGSRSGWAGGCALIGIGALGWGIVTSPTYVFPAIELAGRYGAEIVRERQPVYVSEPAMRPLMAFLLRWRGGTDSQVQVLVDGTDVRELRQAWIIWNPARQQAYPDLIRRLGPPRHPHRNQALGISVPHDWWLLPSAQPVVSFFFVGGRRDIAVQPPSGASDTAPATDATRLLVSPNQAPYTDIRTTRNVAGAADHAADFNYGSTVYWAAADSATIAFHVQTTHTPLRIYRLTALNLRSMQRADVYTWRLEGSSDAVSWTALDSRENQAISQDTKNPSAFSVPEHRPFPHYRIRFLPASANPGVYAGIAEVELYFASPYTTPSSDTIHE